MKKVALVVQRYGEDIIGGAEAHAREIAERLVRDLGFKVSVFTTTAKDHYTWQPHYAEGRELLRGVEVERFHVRFARNMFIFRGFNFLSRPVLKFLRCIPFLRPLNRGLENLWFLLQGPYVPRLLEQLKKRSGEFDRILFFTYLYAPTQKGGVAFKDKAILVPTAHDEPAFYFSHTRSLLDAVGVILANTEAEKKLLLQVAPETKPKVLVAGMGLDEKYLRAAGDQSHKSERPFLLYLGRVGRAKGIDRLLDYFSRYREKSGRTDLELVLAGGIDHGFVLPKMDGVRFRGFVSGEEKLSLLRNAACIVNPSEFESLSLLALEGMALRKPLLLNTRCAVFADYESRLPSVKGFHDFASFCQSLDVCLNEDASWNDALNKTHDWVVKQYSWETVLGIYRQVIAGSAAKS